MALNNMTVQDVNIKCICPATNLSLYANSWRYFLFLSHDHCSCEGICTNFTNLKCCSKLQSHFLKLYVHWLFCHGKNCIRLIYSNIMQRPLLHSVDPSWMRSGMKSTYCGIDRPVVSKGQNNPSHQASHWMNLTKWKTCMRLGAIVWHKDKTDRVCEFDYPCMYNVSTETVTQSRSLHVLLKIMLQWQQKNTLSWNQQIKCHQFWLKKMKHAVR